jgi:hypothetical protein
MRFGGAGEEKCRLSTIPISDKKPGYRPRFNRFLELDLSNGSMKLVAEDTATNTKVQKGTEALTFNAEWDHIHVRIDPLELSTLNVYL